MATLLEHHHDHVVQFYDGDADLIAGAGAYLRDGLAEGAVAIVIASDEHRRAFEVHLGDHATLILLDAAEVLARFMRDGSPDRDAFFDVVGGIVRDAAASGRPVRAYGEMVALLWEAGDVLAAIDLEALWNELASEIPFTLYCAYHGGSVSAPEHADQLQQVCDLHSEVERIRDFGAELSAPADARRLVSDVLRRAGHGGELLEDARLIVSELAANAVVHARSPFSVSIRRGDSFVRLLVRDGSASVPEMRDEPMTSSGRGLRLVATLADQWGVDFVPGGKVVWAELAASTQK